MDERSQTASLGQYEPKGPKDHIKTRILHSGSKAHYNGHTTNHGLSDPCIYVVLGVLEPAGASC